MISRTTAKTSLGGATMASLPIIVTFVAKKIERNADTPVLLGVGSLATNAFYLGSMAAILRYAPFSFVPAVLSVVTTFCSLFWVKLKPKTSESNKK